MDPSEKNAFNTYPKTSTHSPRRPTFPPGETDTPQIQGRKVKRQKGGSVILFPSPLPDLPLPPPRSHSQESHRGSRIAGISLPSLPPFRNEEGQTIFSPRRARSFSNKKRDTPIDRAQFEKKEVRVAAENLYRAFMVKYEAYLSARKLCDHSDEAVFQNELSYTLLRYALYHPSMLQEDQGKKAKAMWKQLRMASGVLLAGTILRLSLFIQLLRDNDESFAMDAFIKDVDAGLEKLIEEGKSGFAIKGSVQKFLQHFDSIQCAEAKELISCVIDKKVLERLEKYKTPAPTKEFTDEFATHLMIAYYLRHIQNGNRSFVTEEELESRVRKISSETIVRTFTPAGNNSFGFSRITFVGRGKKKIEVVRAKKKKSKGDVRTIPKSRMCSSEEHTANLLRFLAHTMIESHIHPPMKEGHLAVMAKAIANKENFDDEKVKGPQELASDGGTVFSDSEDEPSSSFFMKIFQLASFGNTAPFTEQFFRDFPGVCQFQWHNYHGLFPALFSASIVDEPNSRTLRIGLTKTGFYVSQKLLLEVKYCNESFLTYTFDCYTEYHEKNKTFRFDEVALYLKKKPSLEYLRKRPFSETLEVLKKFITVMRYRDKLSSDPYLCHDARLLANLGFKAYDEVDGVESDTNVDSSEFAINSETDKESEDGSLKEPEEPQKPDSKSKTNEN